MEPSLWKGGAALEKTATNEAKSSCYLELFSFSVPHKSSIALKSLIHTFSYLV